MASVELRNVWKKYGQVLAVEDVSWKCNDGEFFSILGPSGCGKSSTLRMIAGLEEITAGDLYFDDRRVNDLPPRERNVAMVFETWALYPNLSVYDNIAFPLWVRNMAKTEIDKKVRWAARFLHLEDILEAGVTSLSGGQKQRVSIGRAIVREPEVLIMDEPISHLDAGLRAAMREELESQVRSLGVTTLYITHDQVESMAMADRIAVMNFGKIQQIGAPVEIYNRPQNEFVAGFIGEPPMNFAECELGRENDRFYLHSPSFRIELGDYGQGKLNQYQGAPQMKLGVRPEDVAVLSSAEQSSVPATVDFVEPQGDRTILIVRLAGAESFLIEVDPDFRPEMGASLSLRFDLDHIHIFEAKTGRNLLY
ncbi:MAG: ABC transporter ATP-binding protein [Chloroflexota bacterium]